MKTNGKGVTLGLLLVASSAWADSVYFSVTPTTQVGKGYPAVHVQILEPIAGFRLRLTRNDGAKVDVKGGGARGQTRDIDLKQPEGNFSYEGELTVNNPDGTSGSMPVKFETSMVGALRIFAEKGDLDLNARKLKVRITRPAGKVDLKVRMDSGALAFDDTVPFNGEPAMTPLDLTWPAAEGRVLSLSVRAYDTQGAYVGVDLFPWFIDIPHEEVTFASGKWNIAAEEMPKLDKSAQLIVDAVNKYGRWAPVRLYVLGFTDTVGPSAANRTLSLNRARSIGSYFAKKGIKVPVLFEGFGEEVGAVATADEVDEVRNRRVRYVLSIDDPEVGASFAPRWQKL